MKPENKYVGYLKDYCSNCTLAGFSYIANTNLHVIERIFWFICVVISAFGSYVLISQYQRDFNSRAVSIVYESLPSTHSINFPTVAACDMYNKYEALPNLIDFVEELDGPDAKDYSYEIENFISFLVYPYIYREGNIKSWCKVKCCTECPKDNLRDLYHRFKTNCSDFFQYCEFSLKPFDCCKYFLPLVTPHGNCFMLNSLLNNKRGSPTWFNNELDPMTDTAKLKIVTKMPTQVSIMNEEDVPHDALPGYKIEANKPGQDKTFQIFMQTMINDPDVRDIAPAFRQCRFPDELLPDTSYKAYSFSTCFVDCLRVHQMNECNCSVFSVMPEKNANYKDCDLEGFLCLEKLILVRPDGRNLLPWAKSKYTCECLPSCTESDFKVVFDYQQKINASNPYLTISVTMPEFATERYRRQALRTRLDVVVTIGGILGLFLGASILSGIEFLYYFTLRLWNNYKMERRQKRQQQQQFNTTRQQQQ
ncbi:pickpocket protein 19 [Lucilia cuprina]|uniref:pickpocket protein 19 n=1 Tax=Lucilia cuprina TaxID=7375 RepID=UPI000C719D9C|nr:pickpocket protein 19 [Lucilia cuprina]KAI8121738.1 Pickpocket protein 19 [Lucilia cuprina]